MIATGKLVFNQTISQYRLFQDMPLGLEYVGFDANGQRVMGLRDTDCIANVVVKDKDFFWKIPDTWTFEEAATIPCAYSTVYLALYIYGKMKKGDKILIHSGTGGIGQAAIHLALKEGCEVFTTVGTSDKQNFIKQTFPTILDEHIGNSRDTSFEQMIMQQTKGRGVDIVLNSLAEEKLLASVRCLAQNGHFLEIGKFDLVSNNPLDMFAFQKGITFHGIHLDNMVIGDHKYRPLLSKMLSDGLNNGTVKPLKVKIFPKTDIEEAFRYMASGKHMGKIIISIQEQDKPLNNYIFAYPRYYCLKDRKSTRLNSSHLGTVEHYGDTACIVFSTGDVLWVPPAQFIGLCDLDLRLWPFDTQVCNMTFGSWTYHGELIDMRFALETAHKV
ncbi:PREDICTED: fatty acid synthase-like [Wasmannia auropunctata]|uniref:fatty acid synthase-like n=1 Tax=Wasmannia auropunctata TaxID=64793 RepID=UPI0005EF5E2B|nr:PREDICTED: fatty acid synthase-like [Wasmannia auropunctata]